MPPVALQRRRTAVAPAALGAIAGTMCVLAVLETLLDASPQDRLGRTLLTVLVAGVPVAVGVYATRLQQDRFGLLLIAAGAFWSLTALAESSESLPYSAGRVAAWLVFPVLVYLMLVFPHGRLEQRVDRLLIAAVTALIAVLYIGSALFVDAYPLHTPWASCDTDCPANAFQVVGSEPHVMSAVIAPGREILSVLVLAGVIATLVRHLRTATLIERRSIRPVLVMSIVWTALLIAFLVVRRASPGAGIVEPLGVLWALTISGIALAFLVGLLRRRLHVATILERLSLDLRDSRDGRQLRSALATALEDPSADILVPDSKPGHWRDTEGATGPLAAATTNGQVITAIDDHGGPVAALVHDPALHPDDDLVEAVGSLVAAAMRHRDLEDELAHSLVQLEESRKRIARIADLERARIERDIHDGAQQRLILLRMRLTQAEELLGADATEGANAVHALGDDVDQALDELRALAHGVYPSLLSARGLDDALRSAVIGSPIPVRFRTGGLGRYPAGVESAVYYTCVEAFQNVLKHAEGRTRATIALHQDGDRLAFAVADDGEGFTPPDQPLSGGLANMRDRIEAAGGELVIDAAPGRGTTVRGSIPL